MIQLKNEEIGISRIVGNKDSVVDHDEDGLMFCLYCLMYQQFANKSGALFKGHIMLQKLIKYDT